MAGLHAGAALRGTLLLSRARVADDSGTLEGFERLDPLTGATQCGWLQRDWRAPGLSLAVAVLDLTDRSCFEPGLREGNAGLAPGFSAAAGARHGRGGYCDSLLPQDGRGLLGSLYLDFRATARGLPAARWPGGWAARPECGIIRPRRRLRPIPAIDPTGLSMNVAATPQTARPGRGGEVLRLLLALAFLLAVTFYSWSAHGHVSMTLVLAAAIGAYMAMNIGANDVANNVGPAVGARAITMAQAVAIAAIFEALGAIIAGGDVVGTIKSGIIDPTRVPDASTFVWLMMAALLAAALWLNVATAMGAPVSTTHSIVGAVLGAGVAAAGWDIANWGTVGKIVASWVVSPLLGGIIAAALLYLIKRKITYQADLIGAARRVVPVLLALMAWAFVTYLLLKGVSQLIKVGFVAALLAGAVAGVLMLLFGRRWIGRRAGTLDNHRDSVGGLFTVPLMFAAALLSFAHGSNDVANAIGPLAAINDALANQGVSAKAAVPMWVMVIGALGLSVGLALYGPRLIRTVGSEITEMDPMRAWCIAMASTLTVIVASQLGLPVSTTHVAIGAVFGVGFLREYLKNQYQRILHEIELHHREQAAERHEVEAFLHAFEAASMPERSRMLKELKRNSRQGRKLISKRERKNLRKVHREALVKRSVMTKIVAAWIITVPASALMAAISFYAIRGASLP